MDRATSDFLIEELINSPLFLIKETGEIYSKRSLKGTESTKFRKLGSLSSTGYLRFYYKKRQIYVHRVIYRKFHGELKSNLVINHKDADRTNNHIHNLELVTEQTHSIYHKSKPLLELTCPTCGGIFKRKEHYVAFKKKIQNNIFCSKKCMYDFRRV